MSRPSMSQQQRVASFDVTAYLSDLVIKKLEIVTTLPKQHAGSYKGLWGEDDMASSW